MVGKDNIRNRKNSPPVPVGIDVDSDHPYGGEASEINGTTRSPSSGGSFGQLHGPRAAKGKKSPKNKGGSVLYMVLIGLAVVLLAGAGFVGYYGVNNVVQRGTAFLEPQAVPGDSGRQLHDDKIQEQRQREEEEQRRREEEEERRRQEEEVERQRREQQEKEHQEREMRAKMEQEHEEQARQSRELEERYKQLQEFDQRIRTIILSSGNGLWNTGVWTGWGEGAKVELMWAAAGVQVDKKCPFRCHFTRDENLLPQADAVVMETINHLKFLGKERAINTEIPWPEKREFPMKDPKSGQVPEGKSPVLPLVGQFYFEPTQGDHYDFTSSPKLQENIDFRVVPGKEAELPITLVCPWGRSKEAFLEQPPQKDNERMLAYFNEHGNAPEFNDFLNRLFELGQDRIHSFIHRKNREMPVEAGGNPFQLENRLRFLSEYKFHLITEATLEENWVAPEWSQAFAAGTVPVYMGAPNIDEFAPGPKSFINARDFSSADELWDFLNHLNQNEEEYMQYHEWKKNGLSETFEAKLHQCAHYAECRICEHVVRRT
eukprot:gb/GECG01001591.1/.p1 GENE.gb/GECG01001591.1/~~gb/GECG01001591.1/.p1  ORF type:complete len:545 (+),score=95.60 gb/GECG01001591.1/:1-1635(+)